MGFLTKVLVGTGGTGEPGSWFRVELGADWLREKLLLLLLTDRPGTESEPSHEKRDLRI